MRILLIEDSVFLQQSLATRLEERNHEVHLAEDGQQGLALVQSLGRIDAVLLDLDLRDLAGMEVLKRIRSAGNNVHVLAISSRYRVADRVESLDQGADDFLAKPFDFRELCARLEASTRDTRFTAPPMS